MRNWFKSRIITNKFISFRSITHKVYYDKPATVDGYGVYVVFKTRQWCWAHILREAKDADKTSRQAHALYDTLKKKFLFAKGLEPPPPEKDDTR